MISVLIPSRNEFLLKRTIDSTLKAARGEIEVIAVCDGYWPDPPIIDDDRVILIHHTEPVGQRKAINEAASIAKGKYILKTDGHSTFDSEFDVKLAKDCEYDWTVIPRMYNLHAFDWVCDNGHRFYQDKADPHKVNYCPKCNSVLKIEYTWKIRKHKKTDFMYMDKNLRVQYWHAYEKRPEAKGKIVDVMNGQGACWFMHKDRFWELGGMDETHGSWGQVGAEVALKAWLSGGRLVVNKNTWFAHVFRTTGAFSFPYKIRASAQEKARQYSRDLWLNNKWPQQQRNFEWLLAKFAPVPTWNGQMEIKDYCIVTKTVDEVYEKRMDYCETGKLRSFYERYTKRHSDMSDSLRLMASPDKAIENFFDSFVPFVNSVLEGERIDIEKTAYYKYLLAHLNPKDLLPELSKKGRRHAIGKVKDAIKLCRSIRDEGMKDPIDVWRDGKRLVMRKGFRRLVILKLLGRKEMKVRIWVDEETFWRNQSKGIPRKWRRRFKKE